MSAAESTGMACDPLAATGAASVEAILIGAVLLLLLGAALVRGVRASRAAGSVLVIACAVLLVDAPAPPAVAVCAPPANSITIVQTSQNIGLSPTRPASTISGRITNHGPDDTVVTAVTVSIHSVTLAPDAALGDCDAGDYAIHDPRMLVDAHLAANGGSTTFSGARIGFRETSVDQNACKGAQLVLLYEME